MSRYSTLESHATVGMAIGQRDTGIVVAYVRAELPGVDTAEDSFLANPVEWDELNALMADFHNSWKTWGNLLDRVLQDYAHIQTKWPF